MLDAATSFACDAAGDGEFAGRLLLLLKEDTG